MLWLAFAVLVILTVAALLYPFVAGAVGEAPARVDFDIVVYRNQLSELDQEIERGLLSPEEAAAARVEIHRRMLAAEDAELSRSAMSVRTRSRPARLATGIAVALIVTAGATATYAVLGSPGLQGKPYAWRQKNDPDFVTASTADRLAELLKSSPTASGYRKLAQMYFDSREYDNAADADRHAVELGATDSGTWSELGEAVVMANNGVVASEAMAAFANALSIDPANARSRFYMGLAEAQIGNLKQAVAIWRDLQRNSDPNASWLPLVQDQIKTVAKQGGFDPASVAPSPPDLKAMNVALTAMTNAVHVQGKAGAKEPAPAPGPAAAAQKETMVQAMVEQLATKMEANPKDVGGWQRLAHAYVVLGNGAKAVAAATRAVRIKPDDVGVLLSLAEAQKAAAPAGVAVPDDLVATMRKVMALDPSNASALYIVGLAERKAGNTAKARDLWAKALVNAGNDPTAVAAIRARLAETDTKAAR
ncbi:MAG: c-type cytochrome biogenesis protein CcmI [Alphaproteobacteria bacterium]|nr:c-type cytochrome biogenesis protein CcmI [Alphaproteobacteria bacterium]